MFMLILSVGNPAVLVFFGRRETGQAHRRAPMWIFRYLLGKNCNGILRARLVARQLMNNTFMRGSGQPQHAATEPFWCNTVEPPRKSAEKRQ
jgi:hypothetical protein